MRAVFQRAFREARRIVSGEGLTASYKAMGPMIGTAPKRLGELDNSEFKLDFAKTADETEDTTASDIHALTSTSAMQKDNVVLSKTVVGFSNSIYRVVHWLMNTVVRGDGLSVMGDLVIVSDADGRPLVNDESVKRLIAEYWPENDFSYKPDSPPSSRWIEQGMAAAAGELSRQTSLSISVSVVDWGPFSRSLSGFVPGWANRKRETYPERRAKWAIIDSPIVNYASNLLAAIDPIQFSADTEGLFEVKPFAEALATTKKSAAGQWQVVLGLYDNLFRQYGGHKFITMPIRVPVVALRLSASGHEPAEENFDDIFRAQTESSRRFCAISQESGHLFLGRVVAKDAITPLISQTSEPKAIYKELKAQLASHGSEVVFVSDSILSYQVWLSFKNDDEVDRPSCQIIGQAKGRAGEFSFRNGFMVREEDTKLLSMLESAQQEVFRSRLKAENMVTHLIAATKDWRGDDIGWTERFFVLDDGCFNELAPDRSRRESLLKIIKEQDDSAQIIEIAFDIENGGPK